MLLFHHQHIFEFVDIVTTSSYSSFRYHGRHHVTKKYLLFILDDVINATYRSITRYGDFAVKFSDRKPLRQSEKIKEEFLEVDFKLKDNTSVKEFFLQVVPREDLHNHKPLKPPGIPLNILIIGVDSLSHAGAKRKLPKIYKFLKEDLKAYIFEGHTVTGDGTTQQLTPMLTGLKFSEQYEGRAGFQNSKTLDDWTWIYKQLKGNRD